MTTPKRQLGRLLLLLASGSVMAVSLHHSLVLPDNNSLANQALTTLVSGPLSGHDLLLVTDDHIQHLLDLDQVVQAAGSSLTPVLLATQHSLLHTPRPAHHTQGSLLTALLLFHQDPTDFLLLLADNTNWNPSYLVLFCLNPHLNTTTVLSQPVVQRSQFILLLNVAIKAGRLRLFAYTSLPMQISGRGRQLIKAPLGPWNPDKFDSLQLLFSSRFNNFGGQLIEVSMLIYDEPFVYSDENSNCIGVNVDALNVIAEKLDFQFSVSSPDVDIWGLKDNGTWKGMLGQLMYDGKHLVINVMQLNPDRFNDFDFTYPYWEDSFAFLLRVPPPLPQWKNILYPFSPLMWGLVLTTTLTNASLLALLLHCINNLEDPVGIVLKVGAGLVSQSMGVREVQAWWARVWLVFWWVAAQTILVPVYTGNLVAVLTVPAFPPVLRTVQDLASTDIRPSMGSYGSFVPDALKTSENPTLAALGANLFLDPVNNPLDPYKSILQKTLSGTHALIVTVDYLIYTQHKKNLTRSTYIMDDKIYRSFMSWFLPRHTPYTSIISHQLSRLVETGLLAKLYEVHIGSLIGEDKQVRGDGVLNLGHLQGAFILLGLGLVIAMLTLLLERLVKPRTSPPPHATLIQSRCPATN